jgi:hypothetical protein
VKGAGVELLCARRLGAAGGCDARQRMALPPQSVCEISSRWRRGPCLSIAMAASTVTASGRPPPGSQTRSRRITSRLGTATQSTPRREQLTFTLCRAEKPCAEEFHAGKVQDQLRADN